MDRNSSDRQLPQFVDLGGSPPTPLRCDIQHGYHSSTFLFRIEINLGNERIVCKPFAGGTTLSRRSDGPGKVKPRLRGRGRGACPDGRVGGLRRGYAIRLRINPGPPRSFRDASYFWSEPTCAFSVVGARGMLEIDGWAEGNGGGRQRHRSRLTGTLPKSSLR
jgi:hypothetical protein